MNIIHLWSGTQPLPITTSVVHVLPYHYMMAPYQPWPFTTIVQHAIPCNSCVMFHNIHKKVINHLAQPLKFVKSRWQRFPMKMTRLAIIPHGMVQTHYRITLGATSFWWKGKVSRPTVLYPRSCHAFHSKAYTGLPLSLHNETDPYSAFTHK